MTQTLKEYFEEFVLLPSAVKSFIFLIVFILFGFSLFLGLRSFVSNRQIEKLQKQNFELNRRTIELQQKANSAEIRADAENEKAILHENNLKILEAKIKNQDEKLQTQSNTSNSLRDDFNNYRPSANTDANRLENRLREPKRH